MQTNLKIEHVERNVLSVDYNCANISNQSMRSLEQGHWCVVSSSGRGLLMNRDTHAQSTRGDIRGGVEVKPTNHLSHNHTNYGL